MSNGFDPDLDQYSVCPYLGPTMVHCLQMTKIAPSKERVKLEFGQHIPMAGAFIGVSQPNMPEPMIHDQI